jgi:DUF1680 family protein
MIDDIFWAPRRKTVRERALPHQRHHLCTGGQFDAMKLTWKPGDAHEPHPFWESDIAKWIEASSYSLATNPDPVLAGELDEAIALLAHAQQPDGYLNAYFTLVKPGCQFTDLQDAHELYGAGHLIEAGVAHHQATGKTNLLDIVIRLADLIDRETLPGGRIEGGYDGHEEIELALVKLAEDTGNRRYLDLSARLIDNRGTQPYYFEMERERRGDEGWADQHFPDRTRRRERYREYSQSHKPVREQREVVGHSVRAMYLYSAMADLARELDDPSLREACEALWQDLVAHKLYVTGGIGSDGSIEGFGQAYDLPDIGSYAETCASIGLVFWAHRMMLLTGEARYIDVLEQALYNGVICGVSLDGIRYFYGNPLASNGTEARQEWFDVACCPPNYARLMTSLGKYIYVQDAQGLYVNLYTSGSAHFAVAGHGFTVTQRTSYPWEGHVEITVLPNESDTPMTLRLRLPAWAQDARLTVDGRPTPVDAVAGYLVIDRKWDAEVIITLDLKIAPQIVYPNPRIQATLGRVALQRGPLVYAFEEVDNVAPVRQLSIMPDTTPMEIEEVTSMDVLGIKVDGIVRPPQAELYTQVRPVASRTTLRAIPYYAWGNRELGTMAIWIPAVCIAAR